MKKREIYCEFSDEFRHYQNHMYTCKVEESDISKINKLSFYGTHKRGKSHQNVEAVEFVNCTLLKVPQGLTRNFPHLKALKIYNCKLNSIERGDLKEYSSIIYLSLPKNEIEILPGNLFADMKNLELISFKNNKLEKIEPALLDGLKSLKYANFYGNPCINKCFNTITNQGNATLEKIKKEIRGQMSTGAIPKKVKNAEAFQVKDCCFGNSKDLVFNIEEMDLQIHEFLLAARSPIISSLIKNNIDAECINLTEIFHEILKFIYTDKLPVSNDINFVHLFLAAGRLKIEALKDFAAEKLEVNCENALNYLTLCDKYECEKLRRKAFETIKDYLGGAVVDISVQPDKLKKMIEVKRKREEMERKMHKELEKLIKK